MGLLGKIQAVFSDEERFLRALKFVFLLFVFFVAVTGPYRFSVGSQYVQGDGFFYYAYTRSLVIDGDLNFYNEYFGEYAKVALPESSKSMMQIHTDHPESRFSMGPGLLWAPFFLAAHLLVKGLNLCGAPMPADGFAFIYQFAVALGTIFYAYLGCVLLYRMCRVYYSPFNSAAAVTAVLFCWSLINYIIYEVTMSHSMSFFVTTAFIYFFMQRFIRLGEEEEPSLLSWALLGMLGGASALMRWQNAIFWVIPLVYSLVKLFKALRGKNYRLFSSVVTGGVLFMALAALTFFPQTYAWKLMYNSYFTVPQGGSFLEPGRPHLLELLFSNNHGLFFWHPVILLSFIGIFYFKKREPLFFTALLAALFLMTYTNSIPWQWWAGGAFGARRFNSCTAIFGLGLAAFLDKGFVRPRPVLAALGALAVWNAVLWVVWALHLSDVYLPHGI